MVYNSIDGVLLKEMISVAASVLEANKQKLNDLNVFPVPDGDTGTNMSLTMQSVYAEVSVLPQDDLSSVAKAMSRGALKGARGNSGVILSQILRGFAKEFDEKETVDASDFIKAFSSASEIAYKAVMKPKEGTVLTVIRVIAEKTKLSKIEKLDELFDFVLSVGEETLSKTPELLPQLKKAGVVDAGGQGLLTILHAFSSVIHGEVLPDEIEPFSFTASTGDFSRATADEVAEMDEITFAYCTEFFIQNLKEVVGEKHITNLRNKLAAIGDSLIVVGDPDLVKVHVHTNDPGKALQYALELGELNRVKIENMVQQHRELLEKRANEKQVGVVAVCSGEGIENLFKDLGVDHIVTGGQTMNPSTEDIVEAVKKVPAKSVIILPNNSNIILAAEQAQNFTDKKLYVLATKTIPQGISAMLAYNPDVDGKTNNDEMEVAFSEVLTGSVTYAVRNTDFDGTEIHEGDILGIAEGDIVACGKNLEETTCALADKLFEKKKDLVTIYYGADASEENAQAVADKLTAKYPGTDIEVVFGGQPVYYYLISVE